MDAGEPAAARDDGRVDELPPAIVDRLRAICAAYPDLVEEPAWTGVRWRRGSVAVAHVVLITDGWPPAYARAAGTVGPACVLTVRCPRDEVEALAARPGPWFAPAWGTRWTPSVLGIRLDGAAGCDDVWTEVADHVDVSYHLAAPSRRASAARRRSS